MSLNGLDRSEIVNPHWCAENTKWSAGPDSETRNSQNMDSGDLALKKRPLIGMKIKLRVRWTKPHHPRQLSLFNRSADSICSIVPGPVLSPTINKRDCLKFPQITRVWRAEFLSEGPFVSGYSICFYFSTVE